MMESVKIVLGSEVLLSFKPAKNFKDFQGRINSMAFSNDGNLLVVASDDDTIRVYDCNEGRERQKVKTKKYGGELVTFAHHNSTVLHASTKIDNAIRYLSLHDNMYVRYFVAHKGRVTSLKVSPIDDRFISTSVDGTVRLWNVNSTNCVGRLCLSEGRKLLATWDNQGMVFGVGIDSRMIKMYDAEDYINGPFLTYEKFLPADFTYLEWVDMTVSSDGKLLLISTDGPEMLIVDAFEDVLRHRISGHKNDSRLRLIGCFSPDSKYVLCGSEDGLVHIWDTSTGQHVGSLNSGSTSPITVVKFNPRLSLFATASDDRLLLWIPDLATNE
eukprot:comp11689_c0_seq1/m.6232 comp11689_c0_seq1/g.6232  ORF comp11689_c0_seq1/g.6232 comp11689_c0_seq1/m.6232 type:complete len:328 (-) comp11689_c0_seq1:128-1111(-)